MSIHSAFLSWQRATPDFDPETYDRNHTVQFENGQSLLCSAAPAYRGDPKGVDPEEAFVASLSSCHMLTFLAIAARKGLVVDAYQDSATGLLEKNPQGRLAMTEVVLRPAVRFGGSDQPEPTELEQLHQSAHRACFIANSVHTQVRVEMPESAPEGLA